MLPGGAESIHQCSRLPLVTEYMAIN